MIKACAPTHYMYSCDNCHNPIPAKGAGSSLSKMKALLIGGLMFDFCDDLCELEFIASHNKHYSDDTLPVEIPTEAWLATHQVPGNF